MTVSKRMTFVILCLALPAVVVAADPLQATISLDGLLGSYDEGAAITSSFDLNLPADSVVIDAAVTLTGWSIPGLYHDGEDPDETIMEYWGQMSLYFLNAPPSQLIIGWLDADTPSWTGPMSWYVSGGVFDWSFLAAGAVDVVMQNIPPSWVGFPVFHRDLFSELTGASLVVTYETAVPNEQTSWGNLKTLWR